MRIVIVLEGCLVQGVFSDAPACRYATIDLDTDGVDRDRLSLTPQGRECTLTVDETACDPAYVNSVFRCRQMGGVPADLVVDMAGALASVVASHDNWRHCSDVREALNIWSETVDRARCVMSRVSAPDDGEEGKSNG